MKLHYSFFIAILVVFQYLGPNAKPGRLKETTLAIVNNVEFVVVELYEGQRGDSEKFAVQLQCR